MLNGHPNSNHLQLNQSIRKQVFLETTIRDTINLIAVFMTCSDPTGIDEQEQYKN